MTHAFRQIRPFVFSLLLAGGALAPGISPAQSQPAAVAASAAPRPWSTLGEAERRLLAPLAADWDQLPVRKQQHMLAKSREWLALPPDEQAKIRDRIARWHAMTPEQRQLARENMRKFHALPEAQREQLHQAYQHFQQLPPAQREALLRKWRSQTIEERQQWLREMQASPHGGPHGTP